MILKDTKENTELKYFFINKFEWTNPFDKERLNGEPKEKRLYRGWYNSDTKGYRIAPSLDKAFWVESLENSTGDTGYISNISLVTKENILDLPINETDLDNLITWLESDNKDLKEAIYGPSAGTPPTPQVIIAKINQALFGESRSNKSLEGFVESAEELQSLDPMAFEILWGFIDHLLIEMQGDMESFDADFLAKGPEGAGINISNAMKYLNRYMSDNRRVNKDPEDLYKSMSHTLNEIIRSEIND